MAQVLEAAKGAATKLLSSKSDQELLSYLNGLYESSRKQRLKFENSWYMNLAFFFGKQYVQWQSSSPSMAQYNRLWEPPAPSWRVRLVSNRIRPLLRVELSKVTKEKPRGFVIPSTSDDDDVAAARAAESIWDFLWREKFMNKVLRRTEFWTLICGTSFVKDWWDKDLKDSNGKPGDICVEHVTPFHLLAPEIAEEEIESQPYLIHVIAKSPEWVEQKYGTKVNPDSTAGSGQILEQKFLSALGVAERPKSMVSVKEAWIKPCKKFPKGTVVTWAADKILVPPTEGFPYEHDQYPFTKFDHIPTGRFYAESTIPDLIPLQKEYNRTRSQIIEAKNRMAKPQLLAARGSTDPNKITSEPGLIVFYTPGFPEPKPLPLQGLPSYVMEELDRNLRDMDDISGQHEITKGRTPPGVTAATAISYLQEEDDSKLAFTIASLEEGVERLGRHFLSHVKQYWAAQRIVRVMGENNQWESHEFSKSDIKGNTDFRVEAGSATPTSKAAKQAFITELGKMGWIPPDKALKYLDMAETGKMWEEMQIDARQAQREDVAMLDGQQIIPGEWHNHEAHIAQHNITRKKQEYEKAKPEVQAIIDQHIQAHQLAIAGQAQGTLPPSDPMQIRQMVNVNAQAQLGAPPGSPPGVPS